MEILFIGNSPFQSSDSVNLDSGAIFYREKTGRLGDRSNQFFVDIYHLKGYTLLNKGFGNEVDRIIELVRSEYWDSKLSLPQIAKKYGFDSHSNVYKFMKKFNIERDRTKKFQ